MGKWVEKSLENGSLPVLVAKTNKSVLGAIGASGKYHKNIWKKTLFIKIELDLDQIDRNESS